MRTAIFTVAAFVALLAALLYAVFSDDTDSTDEPQQAGLTEWEILQLAIAKTESDFDFLAKGKNKDLGVFQITPVFVEEVNRILGDTVYIHEDALDAAKSVEMMAVVQGKHNPEHDITRAIARHNPRGDAIGYARKVRENMEWIRRYEQMRTIIKQEEKK